MSEATSTPDANDAVTVSLVRRIAPAQAAAMHAWMDAGASLAGQFEGFLGRGYVRPSLDSDEWHMLYRFASPAHLQGWLDSPERQWWLGAAQGRIEVDREQYLTGIEGWFDEPASVESVDTRPAPPAPPRWKQMVVIFLVFFPLSLAANWASSHTIGHWPLVLRVLCSVLVMTPVMTYLALPWITRKMEWFLHRR